MGLVKRYALVTFSRGRGIDNKMDYYSLSSAKSAIRLFLGSPVRYDGVGIWDRKESRYCEIRGEFPLF